MSEFLLGWLVGCLSLMLVLIIMENINKDKQKDLQKFKIGEEVYHSNGVVREASVQQYLGNKEYIVEIFFTNILGERRSFLHKAHEGNMHRILKEVKA
jgi:hypothetical protein